MSRKRVAWAVAVVIVLGVLGIATWANSRTPATPNRVVRLNDGRVVRKGDVVATLRRDTSGNCVSDGEVSVAIEDLRPDEHMEVVLRTDEATCEVTVSEIRGIPASSPGNGGTTGTAVRG